MLLKLISFVSFYNLATRKFIVACIIFLLDNAGLYNSLSWFIFKCVLFLKPDADF